MTFPIVQPYLTAEISAISGEIKQTAEDFQVDEIPAYLPCGSGEHVYLWIEKKGMTTRQAVQKIARAAGKRPGDVGVAGLKDSRALTRQWVSVYTADASALEKLDLQGLRVLEAGRHKNKLRIGHLKGNRFVIRVRGSAAKNAEGVRQVLTVLEKQGVPNYFGAQRFGQRADSWQVGHALIKRDYAKAACLLAGGPLPEDSEQVRDARTAFDHGDYETAARYWTRSAEHLATLCRVMQRTKGNAEKALFVMGNTWLWFFITAFQSYLFNQLLGERIHGIDRVETGDLAYKHDSGAVFSVQDAVLENKRAQAFEISPSGPLYGFKMTAPMGRPAELERRVLERSGVSVEEFYRPGILKCQGARRPLRFPVNELALSSASDAAGAYLQMAFTLPPGTYATAVLREILKQERPVEPDAATENR